MALKRIAPRGRRYICSVIGPQSAIYAWKALEGLVFREQHIDVLELFPDEIDLSRGLALLPQGGQRGKLDRYFPEVVDWRSVAKSQAHPQSALRRLYEEQIEKRLGLMIGRTQTVSMQGRAMYRLIFASRSPFAIGLWEKIRLRTPGQYQQDELFLGM